MGAGARARRLGGAGRGCGWLGIGLESLPTHERKFETNENAIQSEMHTISIYPALEGLGFRGLGFRVWIGDDSGSGLNHKQRRAFKRFTLALVAKLPEIEKTQNPKTLNLNSSTETLKPHKA